MSNTPSELREESIDEIQSHLSQAFSQFSSMSLKEYTSKTDAIYDQVARSFMVRIQAALHREKQEYAQDHLTTYSKRVREGIEQLEKDDGDSGVIYVQAIPLSHLDKIDQEFGISATQGKDKDGSV